MLQVKKMSEKTTNPTLVQFMTTDTLAELDIKCAFCGGGGPGGAAIAGEFRIDSESVLAVGRLCIYICRDCLETWLNNKGKTNCGRCGAELESPFAVLVGPILVKPNGLGVHLGVHQTRFCEACWWSLHDNVGIAGKDPRG